MPGRNACSAALFSVLVGNICDFSFASKVASRRHQDANVSAVGDARRMVQARLEEAGSIVARTSASGGATEVSLLFSRPASGNMTSTLLSFNESESIGAIPANLGAASDVSQRKVVTQPISSSRRRLASGMTRATEKNATVLQKLYGGSKVGSACVYQAKLGHVGCNVGCACGMLQDCYSKHAILHRFSESVDVGVCHFSVPVLVFISLSAFFFLVVVIMLVRHLALEWEEEGRREFVARVRAEALGQHEVKA